LSNTNENATVLQFITFAILGASRPKKIIVSAVASRSGGCRERGVLGRPLAFSFVWIDVKWDWLWTGQDKKKEKEASMASISNLPLTVRALV
jgi:hypothetical protein